MKTKFNGKDFDLTTLPKTRKEQFFDILKNDYRSLLLCGAMALLFGAPLIFVICYKYLYINQLPTLSSDPAEIKQLLTSFLFVIDSIEMVCFGLFFLAIAGILRVFRVISWEDGLIFKKDFFKGIRLNGGVSFILGLVVGLFIFLIDISKYSLIPNSNIFYPVFYGLFGFIALPTILFTLEFENYIKQKLFKSLSFSFRFVILSYIKLLAFYIFIFLISLLVLLSNLLVILLALIIGILIVLPIYLLAVHQYDLHFFETRVPDLFKPVMNKGLHNSEIKKKDIE